MITTSELSYEWNHIYRIIYGYMNHSTNITFLDVEYLQLLPANNSTMNAAHISVCVYIYVKFFTAELYKESDSGYYIYIYYHCLLSRLPPTFNCHLTELPIPLGRPVTFSFSVVLNQPFNGVYHDCIQC